MKTTKLFTLALALMFLFVGSALAAPFNTRPIDLGPGYGGTPTESSMQDILDTVLGVGTLDEKWDQNEAAIWQQSEANVSSYKIVSITSVPGDLGVYSYADPTKKALLDFNTISGEASFGIDASGLLFGDLLGTASVSDFGASFGFYWDIGRKEFYTEDDKNATYSWTNGFSTQARALSYLVADGTSVDLTDNNLTTNLTGTIQFNGGWNNTINALGNNDWILGFEDGTDGDFQDAVFYVEDMDPVPEPATILLFGAGLLGLAAYGRKKGFRRS
jgi:hypothetical protein